MDTTLLPIRFVARRLRVTVGWLRNEALAGRVPHLNAGGRILMNPEAVERALVERAKQRGVENAK
jgi:hypothetical protein